MASNTHILFAGGGTAGHLFPGLAVAQELTRDNPSFRISFAVTGKEWERDWVLRYGYEPVNMPAAPMPQQLNNGSIVFSDNWKGFREASRLVKDTNVSLVVGLGGYASVPASRAAISLGVPLVLMEQNVIPGRATRWLARSAMQVCTSFAKSREHFGPGCQIHVTGNPVRSDIAALSQQRMRTSQKENAAQRRLLVLGGSSGSRSLNQAVPFALYHLRALLSGWTIVHQTGAEDAAKTADLYRKFALPAIVKPFIDNMAATYQHTALAITRGGGTTLAELACASVPALVLPLPHSADEHQQANAAAFAAAGACQVFDSSKYTGRFDYDLAAELSDLLVDRSQREHMASSMRQQARPLAAKTVAASVQSLLYQSQCRMAA